MSQAAASISRVSNYLSQAITTMSKAGAPAIIDQGVTANMGPLLQQLEHINSEKVVEISRVLQYSSQFNDIVRTNIAGFNLGDRYSGIAQAFDGIRKDMTKMVGWLDDGPISLSKKVSLRLNNLMKGNISQRFTKIRNLFNESVAETASQIEKEEKIQEGYAQYRFAIKSSEILTVELFNDAEKLLNIKKTELEAANAAVAAGNGSSSIAELELKRDEAISALKKADEEYQIAKDIMDMLKGAYNASELVFAHIDQNVQMKKRIYQRSVTFFTMNETVFTGLELNFATGQGLFEATEVQNAMTDTVNDGVELLADVSKKNLPNAMKAGYGPTLKAKSMKALADAVISYQETVLSDTKQLRQEATSTSLEIEKITNETKDRYVALLSRTE